MRLNERRTARCLLFLILQAGTMDPGTDDVAVVRRSNAFQLGPTFGLAQGALRRVLRAGIDSHRWTID